MRDYRERNQRRPGQPIVVLAALLIAWVGMRAMIWEPPIMHFPPLVERFSGIPQSHVLINRHRPGASVIAEQIPSPWPNGANGVIAPALSAAIPAPFAGAAIPLAPAAPVPLPALPQTPPQTLASHQLMWLAAMGQVPLPSEVAALMRNEAYNGAGARLPQPGPKASQVRRWSMDGWLFLRPDAASNTAFGPQFANYGANYGASQAGAVLRYRLQPSSPVRPTVYARATRALAAGRESEVALGLSARPLARVPLAAQAELRATHGTGGREVRPAAFVVSEFPTVDLPLALRGEAYVAAGYVGGDFATAFVDGQARVDRQIAQFAPGTVRAGAGIWGGAQKGAARIDLGPSASVNLKLGEASSARISMDYRLRVAGDAEPGSGMAVTLSTGF